MDRFISILVLTGITIFATATGAFAAPAVPEPASLSLLATGAGALYVVRKFRRRK